MKTYIIYSGDNNIDNLNKGFADLKKNNNNGDEIIAVYSGDGVPDIPNNNLQLFYDKLNQKPITDCVASAKVWCDNEPVLINVDIYE